MELKLELDTLDYAKAADKLFIELAFLTQSKCKTISKSAEYMGVNRSTLSKKLTEVGRYAEFVANITPAEVTIPVVPTVKVEEPKLTAKQLTVKQLAAMRRHIKATRRAKAEQAFVQLVPLPTLQFKKSTVAATPVKAEVPQLPIGAQNELSK
jgi:hypothetical protein